MSIIAMSASTIVKPDSALRTVPALRTLDVGHSVQLPVHAAPPGITRGTRR